jgi:hypothetical protein
MLLLPSAGSFSKAYASGKGAMGFCKYCGNRILYATLPLSESLARAFNVRGGALDGFPLPQEVTYLTMMLDKFLMESYAKELSDEKRQEISANLLGICANRIACISRGGKKDVR